MTQEDITNNVRIIFITHFDLTPEQFDWEKTLEELHPKFKILSYLVFLEQLIQKDFGKKIPIVENISTAFHTPEDILGLIVNEL